MTLYLRDISIPLIDGESEKGQKVFVLERIKCIIIIIIVIIAIIIITTIIVIVIIIILSSCSIVVIIQYCWIIIYHNYNYNCYIFYCFANLIKCS